MNSQTLLTRTFTGLRRLGGLSRFARSSMVAVVTACAFLTASCGGGGAGEGASLTSYQGVPLAGLSIAASAGQLKTGSTTAITITASAVLAGNVAAVNVPISFTSTGGVLSAGTVNTSAAGQAAVTLQAGADTTNRTIIVTATGGGQSQSITIDINGTTLSLQGTNSAPLATNLTGYTVLLQDGNGTPIANKIVKLSSALGNNLSVSQVTTNATGTATFSVLTDTVGTDTLTAMASGAIATLDLDVTASGLTLVASAPEMDISSGGTKTFTFKYLNGGTPVAGAVVRGSISRGSIMIPAINVSNVYELTTDGAGEATFTVTSTTVGTAVFTANLVGVGSISKSTEFVTSAAAKSTIQATPSTIGPNLSGQSQRSTVLVTVSDANDNPVKGAAITLNANIGTLTSSSITTNSSGQATTTFLSDTRTTATNGVTITATITKGSYSAVKTTSLTVGGQAVFVSIQTDNAIGSASLFYTKAFAVGVIDSNGNPIPGATISASLVPLSFHKGLLTWNGTDSWTPSSFLACPNEDLNFNGVIDTNVNGVPSATEDINGSTRLEPRQIASLSINEPSPGAGPVTDSSGFATLQLKYSKGFAFWASYNVVVRALVSGSEGTASYVYVLRGASEDYNNQTVIPPGRLSPFGQNVTTGLLSPQPTGFSGVQAGCVDPN